MLAASDIRLNKASLLSSSAFSLSLSSDAGIPKECRVEFLCRAGGSRAAIQSGAHVALLNMYQYLI